MAKRAIANSVDLHTVSNSFKSVVIPKNQEQKELMRTIAENIVTFVKGAPGSGKTFMTVNYAIQQLLRQKFDQLVFTRPTVEAAGEKLGFLPGDMCEKINPYMIPIFESLFQLIPVELVNKLMAKNGSEARIRVLPLAFMRGLTFTNSFVLADEAQNSSADQIRMLLTRIGDGTKIVVCGDVEQSDIPGKNGLEDAFELLQGIEGIGFVTLSSEAIVRHPIVATIDRKYSERAKLHGNLSNPKSPGKNTR